MILQTFVNNILFSLVKNVGCSKSKKCGVTYPNATNKTSGGI